MNPTVESHRLLKESRATLIRRGKHQVWCLPNGQKFTESASPSDRRAAINSLLTLRRVLGLQYQQTTPSAVTPGKKRKKYKPGRKEVIHLERQPFNSTLAEQLQAQGLIESALREENAVLHREVERLTELLNQTVQHASLLAQESLRLEAELRMTVWQKLQRWIKSRLDLAGNL